MQLQTELGEWSWRAERR